MKRANTSMLHDGRTVESPWRVIKQDLAGRLRKSGAHRRSRVPVTSTRGAIASITTIRCSALRLTIFVSIVVALVVCPAGQQLMPRGSGAPRSVIILVNTIANTSRDNPLCMK